MKICTFKDSIAVLNVQKFFVIGSVYQNYNDDKFHLIQNSIQLSLVGQVPGHFQCNSSYLYPLVFLCNNSRLQYLFFLTVSMPQQSVALLLYLAPSLCPIFSGIVSISCYAPFSPYLAVLFLYPILLYCRHI